MTLMCLSLYNARRSERSKIIYGPFLLLSLSHALFAGNALI